MTRFWKISPGKKGKEWWWFKEKSVVAIGWDIGDLTDMSEDEITRRIITEEWRKRGYIKEQLMYLRDGMNIRDKIVAYSAERVFGLGEITGGYYYCQDDLDFPHRKNVKWYMTPELMVNNLEISEGLRKKLSQRVTIFDLNQREWRELKKAISKIWFRFI